jgi:antitoxin component YwqK of YwqJK toxin-antitoxin module
MIKKSVYKVLDEDQYLVTEEFINENKQVTKKRLFEGNSIHETLTTYNSDKKILSETDFEKGIELNRLTFKYDEKGRILEQKTFMSGELYQRISTVYAESGFTKTTFLDEEETEKEVKSFEGKNYRIHYYENGELDQYQLCEFDETGLNSVLKAFDSDNNLIAEDFESFNESGKVIGSKDLDGKGNLIREVQYKLDGDLYVEELVKDFSSGDTNYSNNVVIRSIDYDEKGNQTKIEVKSPDGNLLGFQLMEYDDNDRVIVDKGLALGSFNAIYGTHKNDLSFHFVFRYEKVEDLA